jgi:hypothetical protein
MREPVEVTRPAVYLAGPVDDIQPDEAVGWRERIAADWPEILFFCPPTAFLNRSMESAGALDRIEKRVITECNAMLANLGGPGKGFGTIREIEYARSHEGGHRPVVVVGDYAESLMAWDVMVADDIEEGMKVLVERMMMLRERAQDPFGFRQLLEGRGDE